MQGSDAVVWMTLFFVGTAVCAATVTTIALTIHDGRTRGMGAWESVRDIWTHRP